MFDRPVFDPDFPFSPKRCRIHYGYIVALAAPLGFLASVPGHSMGVNVFTEQLIVALGLSRIDVSGAFFVGTGLSAFLLPKIGRLLDRWGVRRLMVFAGVGLALGLIYLSKVDHVGGWFVSLSGERVPVKWMNLVALTLGFLAIRLFGDGALALGARNMVCKWWEERRGRVLSLVGIFGSVMYSLAPQTFNWGIETIGWRETWQLMAVALVCGFCGLAWLLFRDNPEECGLSPDAGSPILFASDRDPPLTTAHHWTRAEAFRSYAFWCYASIFFWHSCFYTGYVFHVVDVASGLGLEKRELLELFFPAALLMGVTNLVAGWACDRIRLKWVLLFMASFSAVGAAALGFGNGSSLKLGFTLGFGLSSGCFITLLSVFVPRFFGIRHMGSISGFVTALVLFGGAMGPLLFSLSKQLLGGYREVSVLGMAGFCLVALGSFWGSRPRAGKDLRTSGEGSTVKSA